MIDATSVGDQLSRFLVVAAAKDANRSDIVWDDQPDSKIGGYDHRDQFGSIWCTSGSVDCSDFWWHYRRLRDGARHVGLTMYSE